MKSPKMQGYRSVGESVKKIAEPLLGSSGRLQGMLKIYWRDIVGEEISACCRCGKVGRLQDGTHQLQVEVHSGHAILLQHQLPEMKERIHNFLGYAAISSIKLVQVPLVKAEVATRLKTQQAETLLPSLQNIEDDEMRQALASLGAGLPFQQRISLDK